MTLNEFLASQSPDFPAVKCKMSAGDSESSLLALKFKGSWILTRSLEGGEKEGRQRAGGREREKKGERERVCV